MTTLFRRLHYIVRQRRLDEELRAEIEFHREMKRWELEREGLVGPPADRAARRLLGNLTLAREDARAVWVPRRLENFWRDLRQAARALRRYPTYCAAIVLTFAIAIGLATTVFSVVYAVLLKPLPYPNAGRVVQIVQLIPRDGQPPGRGGLTWEQYETARRDIASLQHPAFYSPGAANVRTRDGMLRVAMARVSPGYFEAFGVAPILGRSFRDGEDRDGREKVVVLSERMWASRFGRDRSVVGTTLVVNDAPYEVVGVVPASFDQPSMAALRTESGEFDGRPELWLPLVFVRPASTTGFTILSAIGSLSPDAGAEQASAELTARLPPLPNGRPNQGFVVTPLAQFMTQPIVPAMRIFEFAVALVFLIACANVTNLALARATQLRGELGCRLALGASRGDLLRQTCAELGVLSLAGSATGVALASLCLTLVTALPPETLPRVREVSAAPVMFVFAGALSGVAALSTAAFVTWRVLQSDPIASMRHSAATAARVTSRPSSVLVVAQIAAATVLLSGAALLLASFASLARSDRGYDPRGLVSFNVSLPRGRYATAAAQRAFYDSVVNRLTQAPGVDRVGVGQTLPFVPRAIGSPTLIDGRRIDGVIAFSNVGARFFSAVGVTVVAGREFDVRDTAVSERVAVIDDEFARMYFAGTDPLGHVVGFMEWPPARIVGVIRTPKGTLAAMRANYPAIYFPMTQLPAPTSRMPETAWLSAATIAVHTSEDFGAVAAAIRTIVRDLDPLVPVYDILPVEQRMADGIISQRFYGYASTLCAIVAGLLAAVGLYGVIAYSVAARRHEFGIRVAVGASSRTIAALVQRSGLVLVTSGVLIGAFGAWAVDGLLASLLHGVQPHDLRFLVAVAVLVVAVGAGACYLPARAATKIDPVRALNS